MKFAAHLKHHFRLQLHTSSSVLLHFEANILMSSCQLAHNAVRFSDSAYVFYLAGQAAMFTLFRLQSTVHFSSADANKILFGCKQKCLTNVSSKLVRALKEIQGMVSGICSPRKAATNAALLPTTHIC